MLIVAMDGIHDMARSLPTRGYIHQDTPNCRHDSFETSLKDFGVNLDHCMLHHALFGLTNQANPCPSHCFHFSGT